MAWIEQVSEGNATGSLKGIYDAAGQRAGRVANILKIMSLRPKSLQIFLELYIHLMRGNSTLPRTDRELLATVTSQVNNCYY